MHGARDIILDLRQRSTVSSVLFSVATPTTPHCTLSDVASAPTAAYIAVLGVPLTERSGPDGLTASAVSCSVRLHMEQLMKSYFFHLNYPRDYIIDPDGSELPDLEADLPLRISSRID